MLNFTLPLIPLSLHKREEFEEEEEYEEEENRYSSVAGINFRLVYKYLTAVLVISEGWIFLQAFRRRTDFYHLLEIKNNEAFFKILVERSFVKSHYG